MQILICCNCTAVLGGEFYIHETAKVSVKDLKSDEAKLNFKMNHYCPECNKTIQRALANRRKKYRKLTVELDKITENYKT